MRTVIWNVCFVLGIAGCVGAGSEPTTNVSAIELSTLPADELMADRPAVEAALRNCPVNCIGVCACQFLRCVQGGGDVAECTELRDACAEDCGVDD